jgi:hypothetical protein
MIAGEFTRTFYVPSNWWWSRVFYWCTRQWQGKCHLQFAVFRHSLFVVLLVLLFVTTGQFFRVTRNWGSIFLFVLQITFLQDAEERLSVVYGIPVEINPEFLKHTDITNRAFLLRLLFNLKRIYFERKDPVR